MKKLLLLIGLIFLFSCEKEASICWDCEVTTIYTSATTQPETVKENLILCDRTKEEVIAFERDQYVFITIKVEPGRYSTTEIKYKCKEQ